MSLAWINTVIDSMYSYPDSLQDWDYDYNKYLIHSNMTVNLRYLF